MRRFDVQHTNARSETQYGVVFDTTLTGYERLDLVEDPFVGSGTVALAYHRHGRCFIGGDLGHHERDGHCWADVANEQLAQEPLFTEATACP